MVREKKITAGPRPRRKSVYGTKKKKRKEEEDDVEMEEEVDDVIEEDLEKIYTQKNYQTGNEERKPLETVFEENEVGKMYIVQ